MLEELCTEDSFSYITYVNEKDDCSFSLHSTTKDVAGRDFKALDVLSFSLEYMRTKIIENITEKFPGFSDDDLYYVITTPAIWSEQAKKFMRKAAQKASIPDERLRIALEPECAAVYVYTKHLPTLGAVSRDKRAMRVGSCHLILDLGGCELFKKAAHEKFPDKTFLIPTEAETSIMKGAIIFGRDQSVVDKRIMPYTYGLDWNEDYDPKIHDLTKRVETEDGYVCRDIFRKLIEKGASVPYNKPTQEIDAYATYKYQTVIEFPFYRSERLISPRYIDEEGCHFIGKMSVDIGGNSSKGIDTCVKLKVYFGATELIVEAVNGRGKKYEVTFSL